jgi:energy-coupling factor transporter ATP-binding protein EcfA2
MIKKAEQLSDFFNVFSPEPLKEDEMEAFYCADTMIYRTGDEYVSPINDIRQIMKSPSNNNNAVLFLGHKGCGKSTELVRLKSVLQDDGYCVEYLNCKLEIDLPNAEYEDLFILMTQKLIKIADDLKCDVDKAIIKKALSYWDDKEVKEAIQEEIGYHIGSEISAGTGLGGFLKAFIKISGYVKNKSERRTEVRKNIERRASEWIAIIESISHSIQCRLNGKAPILILEELDKMYPEKAIEIFYNNASALSQIPFKAIYTFPINLYYSEKFSTLKSYFRHKTLPMIRVHNRDMSKNEEGADIIKDIVYRRAEKKLFDCVVLDEMIIKTGGSLRDLFEVIINAGNRADNRKADKIEKEDAVSALNSLQSDLTRIIEVKDYEFLKDAYNKKEQIRESSELLKFMEALIILEYNGRRWHDLHPLVYDFLKEQGIFG